MRENPRPTRHLEQFETAQFGKPAPGSVSGPAWDLVALPGPPHASPPHAGPPHASPPHAGPPHAGPPHAGVPEVPEDDAVEHSPAPAAPVVPAQDTSPPSPGARPRRRTVIAVGCGVLAAFALGIGGLTMLWADRPDADTSGPVDRIALDLPLIPTDENHDAGTVERAETRPRDADDAEAGEPRDDGVDASLSGDGTASSGGRPDQGGTGDGAPGAGTGGSDAGGSGNPGSGGGGGTGPGGGGTTTPTAGPPPPTTDPTTGPTEEPTPEPTPTTSGEPSPEPTPTPSVSPSPGPTGAPVSPKVSPNTAG